MRYGRLSAFVSWGVDGESAAEHGRAVQGPAFEREIIVLCVRWYLRYKPSLRDLAQMMAERGLALAHTIRGNCTFGAVWCASARNVLA